MSGRLKEQLHKMVEKTFNFIVNGGAATGGPPIGPALGPIGVNIMTIVNKINEETAEYAVQAALTGHMVLSTLHTNDAPTSITRMLDLGIEPYMAATAIAGGLAQRLVRKICPHCKMWVELGAAKSLAYESELQEEAG